MKRKMMHIIACVSIFSLIMTGCGATTVSGTDETDPAVVENTVAADVSTASKETAEPTPTAEPTTEPTVEPTTEPTVEPTAEPVTEPTATAEPTPEVTPEPTEEPSPAYTYTDMSATMYAKSSVNVRDLPSTDGAKVGGLTTNQEVTVTGQCVETNWYRIQYKDDTAYVSNNYIVTEKVPVQTASSGSHIEGSKSTDNPLGISEDDFNKFAEQMFAGNSNNGNKNVSDGYFDRAMAEEVFALVNAERRDAGIAELVWDESLYEIATQRCYENDGHASARAGTGENYAGGQYADAQELHQTWHNSPGHYANYMDAKYTTGAVAIYKIPQGDFGGLYVLPVCVSYEVFSLVNTSVSAQNETAGTQAGTESWRTPPEPTNGLEEWKNKNPGVQVEVNTN